MRVAVSRRSCNFTAMQQQHGESGSLRDTERRIGINLTRNSLLGGCEPAFSDRGKNRRITRWTMTLKRGLAASRY